ncbi:MFS transporter [Ramlibacter solisilvae]|uniref:MFS transporter n=1 Tax=Ramlibacter tataouinensis TaxID=94132 RepID=A0A127JRI5_9BURK|nr:MFS transporter [Ramlibacter tataouinensis]AMO22525.1 MFS transporter [Ramlibacter tataouinensis]
MPSPAAAPADPRLIDSRQAALRLLVVLGVSTLGNSGMYVLSVVLPAIQADFGVDRGQASFPYALTMIGFGIGGVLCGRWADRYGLARVVTIGAVALAAGYVIAALAPGLLVFDLAHGVLIGGLGVGCAFVPLIADTSLWWDRRRGIAVAVCASGNYLAGTLWPPIIQFGVEQYGWRPTYIALGIIGGVGMALLATLLRQRPPMVQHSAPTAASAPALDRDRPFGLSPGQAQAALFVAGVGCCVAMSMPQVHIVAYCADLGYGAARGATMLSLMLGFGIVSRLASGWISDRIGGLRTLLLGSVLQCVALLLFLPFDGLASLFVISALFGLFQGGIVPSYAIIIRESFAPQEAGARVGTVILGTLIGMALGGWMSGKVFDLTGSYTAAFVNGIAWNLLNFSIAFWLYTRSRRARALAAAAAARA